MSGQANCPACGAALVFKTASSAVIVCAYCSSVVARTDRALSEIGKVAEIIDTGSSLALGVAGRYKKAPFTLVGRAQIAHPAGGTWDEWYAAFDDGRWGWLAEAQGRYYLTFEQPQVTDLPAFAALEVGAPARGLETPAVMTVSEKGRAVMAGASGEIPYVLKAGAPLTFADLSGPGGAFATLDYSDAAPVLFLGREVTLQDLGITEAPRPPTLKQVDVGQLNCPRCGGPLALRVPDQSERVTCPNCSSLLDINEGQLKFLTLLKKPQEPPVIALGAEGVLDDVRYTVVGMLVRSVHYEGQRYPWQEYLLHNPGKGFRWLVLSDGHFSLGENVSAGDVEVAGDERKARFGGERYRLFQVADAKVDAVLGEFYWRVETGETVQSADFVNPPQMLSRETTALDAGAELQWTLLRYLPRKDVAHAFKLEQPPTPTGVAPNEPFMAGGVFKLYGLYTLALIVVGLLLALSASRRVVLERHFVFEPVTQAEGTQVVFSDPFELKARQNIEVRAESPVNNTWVYLQGDLVGEDSGLVQPMSLPIEYYHGVDGGESWSEGSQSMTQYLSAVPAGRYILRLEAQWNDAAAPAKVSVRVRQGVPHFSHFLVAFLLLSVVPMLLLIARYTFELRRWRDSDYNPYSSE